MQTSCEAVAKKKPHHILLIKQKKSLTLKISSSFSYAAAKAFSAVRMSPIFHKGPFLEISKLFAVLSLFSRLPLYIENGRDLRPKTPQFIVLFVILKTC